MQVMTFKSKLYLYIIIYNMVRLKVLHFRKILEDLEEIDLIEELEV
jgi:hypothetical protein